MRPSVSLVATALISSFGLSSAGWPVEFNRTLAEFFGQMSAVAFCDEAAISTWTCGVACEGSGIKPAHVQFIAPGKKYHVQAYVAALAKDVSVVPQNGRTRCVVAFRGSVNFNNWVADGYIVPTAYAIGDTSWCHECRVHSGFQGAYSEIRDAVSHAVEELKCQDVYMAGHSLGSAVAQHALADYRARARHDKNLQVPPAFLYGVAAIGEKSFVESLAAITPPEESPGAFRFINQYDPVPHLTFMGTQYGVEIFIKQSDGATVVCPTPEDERCHDGVSKVALLTHAGTDNHCKYFNINFAHSRMAFACLRDHPDQIAREFGQNAPAASIVL